MMCVGVGSERVVVWSGGGGGVGGVGVVGGGVGMGVVRGCRGWGHLL